jgi:hypothetical protein
LSPRRICARHSIVLLGERCPACDAEDEGAAVETGEVETTAESRATVQLDYREHGSRTLGHATGASGGYRGTLRPGGRYLGDDWT